MWLQYICKRLITASLWALCLLKLYTHIFSSSCRPLLYLNLAHFLLFDWKPLNDMDDQPMMFKAQWQHNPNNKVHDTHNKAHHTNMVVSLTKSSENCWSVKASTWLKSLQKLAHLCMYIIKNWSIATRAKWMCALRKWVCIHLNTQRECVCVCIKPLCPQSLICDNVLTHPSAVSLFISQQFINMKKFCLIIHILCNFHQNWLEKDLRAFTLQTSHSLWGSFLRINSQNLFNIYICKGV